MNIVGDEHDSKGTHYTGFFRDGARRIDMVLVAKESGDKVVERLKMDFLSNCLNMGLHMEVEAGMGSLNADLLFIKLHAPDHIMKHFGYFYNMRKFFKKSHLEFIWPRVKDEKELIKSIRRLYIGPVNYNNMERSTIMYKILLSMPFGYPANYVGVNQLVEHDIFLDMFPLHDGPCHFLLGQNPIHINGRQALFYTWCNFFNLFRLMPIHLIREYLGERIGFLFAFYQFYNVGLFILSAAASGFFYLNFKAQMRRIRLNEHGDANTFDFKYFENGTQKWKNYTDFPVCPKCRDFVGCPFRFMMDYETELKCKLFLDNPFNFILIFLLTVWGILLFIVWKRQEFYLFWLWETYESDAKVLTRPAYRNIPRPKTVLDKKLTAALVGEGDKLKPASRRMMKFLRHEYRQLNREAKCKKLQQFLVMMFIIGFLVLCYFPMLILFNEKLLNRMRTIEEGIKVKKNLEQFNYFAVAVCGVINGLGIFVMEGAWWYVWKYLAAVDNPHSEGVHEERHFANLISVSILINFFMIFFYAYLKGALFTFPNDSHRWATPLGLGLLNCGILTCVDELFIYFIASFKAKICFQELIAFARTTKFKSDSVGEDGTDDNPNGAPAWEREFKLKPINEDTITAIYYKIFLQYAMATFFITSFQLAPAFAFFYNIWEMRYLARLFIVHGRRPMLTQTWSLGGWTMVLFALPYFGTITNLVFTTIHNTVAHRRFDKRYWKHQEKRRFLIDHYMAFFNTSDALLPAIVKKHFEPYAAKFPVPKFCMWSGQYNRFITFAGNDRIVHTNVYVPMAGHYYILWHQAMIVLLYIIITLFTGTLLHHVIKLRPRDVAENRYVEEHVKNYDITKAMATRDKL